MLEVCVGRQVLQSGLRNYLNEYRYSNAGTDDLWEALTKAAAKAQTPLNVKVILFSAFFLRMTIALVFTLKASFE